MKKIKFAVIGSGWRAKFYFRIATEARSIFDLVAVVEPNEERAQEVKALWGFNVVSTYQEAIQKYEPEFFVVSKGWDYMPKFMKELSDAGQYVLAETYELASPELLAEFYSSINDKKLIQSAEQFIFQPHHEARFEVIKNGMLGKVTQAQISSAHGYHGMSLMRHYLNAGFENCLCFSKTFTNPVSKGPGRTGYANEQQIVPDNQQYAMFTFADKWSIHDFTGEQYFSQIRKNRILIRGEKGEIDNKTVRTLLSHDTPVEFDIKAYISGTEGDVGILHTTHITGGERMLYKNPFGDARISDDEIAVAKSLYKMGEYVRGGDECYSFEQSCQDQYLSIIMKQSMREQREIETQTQIWAK